MSGLVRDKLSTDRQWATFTTDQRRWICLYCLAAISRRPQRSWEDSIGAHLEGCRHYGGGRFQPQPAASVAAQLSYENMICTAETDAAWGVFDALGVWICPACLERVPEVRMVANQRNQLTYRAMALHLQRCSAYGHGQINAAPVVRAAKERPAPPSRPAANAPPVANAPPAANAPPVATPLTSPIPGRIPVATPLGSPTQPKGSQIGPPVVGTQPRPVMPTPLPGSTGAQLRVRRFLTPQAGTEAGGSPPVEAPTPAEVAPNLGWMDDANQAAGAVAPPPDPSVQHERTDLQRARDLQQTMLAAVPEITGYRFATRYEPCDHVSGDFFSFVNLLDGRVGFAIGDVSGHGMQAGLVMMMAKKTLEIYGELIGDPAEVLAKVNDALAGDLGGKMFVSMTYAILSPSERTIRWVRAGHNPTMLVNINGGDLSEIKPPGMVVGMKAGQVFRDSLQTETTQVRSGDLFLLYTDGVTEMTNSQGEEFETERLGEIVRQFAPTGPEALLTQVMDRVRHFRGTKPVADDVTLLALAVD